MMVWIAAVSCLLAIVPAILFARNFSLYALLPESDRNRAECSVLIPVRNEAGDIYRVAGITVQLPPLRERPRDLRVLLERSLAGTKVSPEARAALLAWSWPGNVRELLSAVEAARALAGPGGRIETAHLPPPLRAAPEGPPSGKGRYREAVDEAKKRVILETLTEAGGNRTRAAALLGLSRQSLLYEMKRLAVTD